MGKTFRRDKPFRPKVHGRTFNKDHQPWKKPKRPDNRTELPPPDEINKEHTQ